MFFFCPSIAQFGLRTVLSTRQAGCRLCWFGFGFFNRCFCVYHQPQKPKQTTSEKRGSDGEKGREFPVNLLFVATLSQGGSVGASALGCVLVSASSASLGQLWHLFHQALSRNCPNFPDRHSRCCQISS